MVKLKEPKEIEELIPLPPKWKVKDNFADGYNFLDAKNNIQLQNLKDNNSMRKFCWGIYNKMEGK